MNSNLEIKKLIAWPFKEAEKILQKLQYKTPEKGYILFETGYGPSGLPHIGTLQEVMRTIMVMNALKILAPQIPTRLFVYSDDLDGLRKVPDNVPQREMLANYIGFPLSKVPDPYGQFENYAHYMNNKLKSFLDGFGFQYEFKSATEGYQSGHYNEYLKRALLNLDKILAVMKPSLGEERQESYHPFLPISSETGKFIFTGVTGHNCENNTITFINDLDNEETISILDGHCKLQWKADWAMRWAALDVNYEMHGKDLTPTAKLSGQICKILGGKIPQLFVYELFTDELGQKISKSKGNGVSVDEWLQYGTMESLALFMYDHPERSIKLYLRTIPKYVDEYIKYSRRLHHGENLNEEQLYENYNNPTFHIPLKKHDISANFKIDFALIMNLASACNPENPEILRNYIAKYQADLTESEKEVVDELIIKALNFYNVFIKPNKKFLILSSEDKGKLEILRDSLIEFFKDQAVIEDDAIQNRIYHIAHEVGYEKGQIKDWFKFLYQALFGQESGPKFGSFINIYGRDQFIELIDNILIKI